MMDGRPIKETVLKKKKRRASSEEVKDPNIAQFAVNVTLTGA
jgi:hypothetical protein